MTFTLNQLDVLQTLRDLRNRPDQCSRRGIYSERHKIPKGQAWATPQDMGAHNGSHHSGTATALAKRGLVDRYKYDGDTLNYFKSKIKGACVYRITDAGIAALAEAESNKRRPA